MGITTEPPRGGVVERFGGKPFVLILRLAEIERFEDAHRGIFEVWDGFFAGGQVVSAREAQDLVALGLVGGGVSEKEADRLVRLGGPEGLPRLRMVASGLLGAAFYPDATGETDAPEKSGGGRRAPDDLMSDPTSAPQPPAGSGPPN